MTRARALCGRRASTAAPARARRCATMRDGARVRRCRVDALARPRPTPSTSACSTARRRPGARPRLRPRPPRRARCAPRACAALGVDVSPVAVALARARRRDACSGVVFDAVPAPGTLAHARCCSTATSASAATRSRCCAASRELLAPGGAVLVELDPPGVGRRVRRACGWRRRGARASGSPWARVGADGVDGARRARPGCASRARWRDGGRWFAELAGGHEAAARPVPRRLLALPAARAVADGRCSARSCSCSCSSWRSPGFLSHAAYQPDLGATRSSRRRRPAAADVRLADAPAWLYAVTQGLHVNVGLVAVPLLLAKLWSVIPRLFAWPPVASAGAGARAAVARWLLVGGAVFEFATGLVNASTATRSDFNFVVAHYYGAWVFLARARPPRRAQAAGRCAAPTASAACSSRCATTSRAPAPSRTSPAASSPPTPPRRRSAAAACSRSSAARRGPAAS